MANEVVPFAGLVKSLADRFEVTPQEMIDTLKVQCFQGGAATNGQLMMLCSFAKQYDLNPLARECYAFISTGGKNAGRMTVGVQADGWTKIANRHRDEDGKLDYDGQEMEYERDKNGALIAIVSKTYVKNRRFPTVYRAVMKEWNRAASSDVWKEMPEHQLFVKAQDEGIRFAFGVSAYDPDSMERLAAAQGTAIEVEASEPKRIEQKSEPVIVAPTPEQVEEVNSYKPSEEIQNQPTDEQPQTDSPARAHLDALIAKNVTQARLNLLLGQAGADRVEDLSDDQVAKLIIRLEKK